MNIKLDENIPYGLVNILADMGHIVDTVPDEGLIGADDSKVWASSRKHERFFITQDLDFSDMRRFKPGPHPGILLVRLKNPGSFALTERIRNVFIHEKIEDWRGCFVVITENKIRVRYPAR